VKTVGNSSRGRSQGVPKIFRAPMYMAHCAVIFAIAQLSCSRVLLLSDGPCLTSIQQDWEYIGPAELHLRICAYMRPPDILLEDEEAVTPQSISDFLLMVDSNHGRTNYRLRDIFAYIHVG